MKASSFMRILRLTSRINCSNLCKFEFKPTHLAHAPHVYGGGNGPDLADDNGAEVVERLVERVETWIVVVEMRLTKFGQKTSSCRFLFVLNGDDDVPEESELGERLAEVMLKRPQFISPVLAVLEQDEFAVRRISVQLLTSLLRHRGTECSHVHDSCSESRGCNSYFANFHEHISNCNKYLPMTTLSPYTSTLLTLSQLTKTSMKAPRGLNSEPQIDLPFAGHPSSCFTR
ncbi:unnamed protein product, partial [Mesorhabditis belari]|uniref:Uncharacterized protein n=1 Tax=Mesorhabditis belari TaxID=2138241 RepID=A0AAF3F0D0_9BILA